MITKSYVLLFDARISLTPLIYVINFQGFREMQENKQQIIGSSTACLMMLSHTDLKLYTTNIGDSGFLVVRQGEVVHRSVTRQK